MKRSSPIRRTAPRRKRRGGPRRGDNHDRKYMDWMHTHGCLVAGKRSDSPCRGVRTVHHLRHKRHVDGTYERTGKDDRRTLTLCEGHHLKQMGPHAVHSMTANNGEDWEAFFGIDAEEEIRRYNARYEDAECGCRFRGDQADASDCDLHGSRTRRPAVRLVMEEGNGDDKQGCPF